MQYTITTAAQATGKDRTTIHRAIKSGKISATRDDTGAYHIDASELHRVYPMACAIGETPQPAMTRHSDAIEPQQCEKCESLERERQTMQNQIDDLHGIVGELRVTIQDLRDRLDASESERRLLVQARITDQRPGLLKRLFG